MHDQVCIVAYRDRAFTQASIALPACRATGGDTGIPWGTDGVWVEPVDEEAARRTVDRLQQFWHKKGDGFGTLTGGGAHAERPADAAPGEGHVAADGATSDSEGGGRAVVDSEGTATGHVVNAVCTHVACSPHAFCLVEQLETVRDSYGKSRSTHFNRKPISVQPSLLLLGHPVHGSTCERVRASVGCVPHVSLRVCAGRDHAGLNTRRAAPVSGCGEAQSGQEDDGELAQPEVLADSRARRCVKSAAALIVPNAVQEKLQEIINTGQLSRTAAWAEDPTRKVKEWFAITDPL